VPSSLGPAEILVILVVALIVLGPTRLPQAARQVGKAIAEVRRWSSTVEGELRSALDVDDEPAPPSPTPVLPAAAEPELPTPRDLQPPTEASEPRPPVGHVPPPAAARPSAPPVGHVPSPPPVPPEAPSA
jgi:sec-independent protein translocase protein TatA